MPSYFSLRTRKLTTFVILVYARKQKGGERLHFLTVTENELEEMGPIKDGIGLDFLRQAPQILQK